MEVHMLLAILLILKDNISYYIRYSCSCAIF